MVATVLALGALGGTALADDHSGGEAASAEATSVNRQMATDEPPEVKPGSSAVVNPSDLSARIRTQTVSTGPPTTVALTRAIASGLVKSLDADPSPLAQVAEVFAEPEAMAEVSIESPPTLKSFEPQTSNSATTSSVETEPVITSSVETESVTTAEVTAASGHEVSQCNPPEFPGATAGWEVTCEVTIENTVTEEGDTSSTTTTRTCLAAAGEVPPAGCTPPVTTTSDELVTSVDQCNGVATGGGSNVTCDVTVINNVPEGTPTTPITVNQCNGSGEGGVDPVGDPLECSGPADQETVGADVDQCNGSANGGGAPGRVECSVEGEESAVPLTIDQCNGSANGGGGTVTCTVTVTNNFTAPADGGPDEGEPDEGEPDQAEPDQAEPDQGEPDQGEPDQGEPDAGGLEGSGFSTGGTGSSGTSSMPSAIAPVQLAIPSSTAPAPAAAAAAAAASGSSRLSSEDETQALAAGSELSSLPATGSAIGSMAIMALMAMMLGGLMILVSRSTASFATKR